MRTVRKVVKRNRAIFRHDGVEYLTVVPDNCATCSVRALCYARKDGSFDHYKKRAEYCSLQDVGSGIDITKHCSMGKDLI